MAVALAIRTLPRWSLALRTLFASMPGASTLPTPSSAWLVVQLGHFEWSPRPEPSRPIGWRRPRSDDHSSVGVGEGFIETRPLHVVSDGVDGLLDVKLCTHQLSLLPSYVIQLFLDATLQSQLFSQS